ncbi:copper resistance protein CopC [Chakrabartia godavariana]|nr:copper resistance protein CopC [Chakrabartia godavariana]
MNKSLSLIAFGAALALASPAVAQVKLVASAPAANKAVAKPMAVSLTFSDKIAASAGMDIVMLTMPGMKDHPPMKISGFTTSIAADGKTLLAKLPRPLPVGTYVVNWRATGTDGVAATGKINFAVK